MLNGTAGEIACQTNKNLFSAEDPAATGQSCRRVIVVPRRSGSIIARLAHFVHPVVIRVRIIPSTDDVGP
jgi:hypothetical protein